MKNQFVADKNDYFKYGILRAISDKFAQPIGLWWMLTSDDAGNHGNNLAYLNNTKLFRPADEKLFNILTNIINGFIANDPLTRNVGKIEQSEILQNALYWPHEKMPIQPTKRSKKSDDILKDPYSRAIDLREMKKYFSNCPVIFADPDNGIEVKTASKERHIRWNEISNLYEDGHSLIIYQHVQHTNILQKADAITEQLQNLLGCNNVQYRALGSVVFLIIPREEHLEKVNIALGKFDKSFSKLLINLF